MLIIELTPLANGAHRNQSGPFMRPPVGWAIVPPELEADAQEFLPFIDLTVEDGKITAVAQGVIPEPEPEPEPEPTVEDRVTTLEETSATKDDVQAVWDSMAAAYQEGVETA